MPADGSVVIQVTADDKEAQKRLQELRKEITKTENQLSKTEDKRNVIAEKLQTAREEAQKTADALKELRTQQSENNAVLSGRTGDISPDEHAARKQAQAELTAEIRQQEQAQQRQSATISKLEGQAKDLEHTYQRQTAALEGQKTEAGALERVVNSQATSAMPNLRAATDQVSASIKKGFRNTLKWGLGIRSTFILMRRLRSAIIEGVKAFAQNDPETKANIDSLKASLATLKASWGAAFAPIFNMVAPALQKLIGWLQTAANYVQMFFAALSGKGTWKKAVQNQEALAGSLSGTGAAAKEAQKQLLGFDEINKLNDNDSGSGGGSGGSPSQEFEETPINSKFQEIVGKIRDNFAAIEFIVGTSLLALGAILAISGTNIPLGLGLMAVGALTLSHAVRQDWSGISEHVRGVVMEITAIVGMALLAIGAIVAFSGANIPLGIGLMAAGALSLGAVALNWGNLTAQIQNEVSTLMIVLGGGMLVLGAILAFSGANIPVGIALMAAGGVSLAAGIGLNWNAISDKVGEVKEKIINHVQKLKDKVNAKIDEIRVKIDEFKGRLTEAHESYVKGIDETLGKVRAVYEEKGGGVKGAAAALMEGVKGTFSAGYDFLNTLTNNRLEQFRQSFVEKFNAIRDKASEVVQKVKEFFNFKWEIPHIRLPHITVSWTDTSRSSIAKLLGITAIPRFGIQWYAKGGLVDGATLFGAGEAGKEAVVPLERHTEWIKMVADGIIDGLTSGNQLADYITGRAIPAIASGQIVPPRALSGGGMLTDADIDRLVSGITAAFSTEGGSDNQQIKLYLDGRQIAETVTKHQRQMSYGRGV